MKKFFNYKKSILISLMMLVLIGAYFKYHSSTAPADEETIWVQASKVKEMSLPTEAHAIGTLVARSVEITPEISGHVEKLLFKDGTFVKENTPLFQLDDTVYKAKYASAKAQLTYSENDYKRKLFLGKQGVIAKQAIDQADADLKQKKADAEESAVMVNKMQLTAPFDGVVGKSKVNRGDYVTTGTSVVTITDVQHLHIEYNIPEKYLPLLKLGQTVSITTATYPGKVFTGTVAYIAPSINTENRSVSIYAEVANKENKLASGMFVDVSHALGTDQHVIMIPARSIVPILDGLQVYKVSDGKAFAVTVLVGKRSGENVEITQGLSVGDTVITDGQLKVKNNVPVKISA